METIKENEILLSTVIAIGAVEEFERRCNILGLTKEQKNALHKMEGRSIMGKNLYLSCAITFRTTFENLPKPETLTISELIALIDDAYMALERGYEDIAPDLLKIVQHITGTCGPYDVELFTRLSNIGFIDEQIKTLVANECVILNRVKWGQDVPDPWQ